MIILGIDPGTAALGYGVIERTGARLRVREAARVAIDHDAIEAGAGDDHREPVRELVQPRGEQLERIEHDTAKRQVPQQE